MDVAFGFTVSVKVLNHRSSNILATSTNSYFLRVLGPFSNKIHAIAEAFPHSLYQFNQRMHTIFQCPSDLFHKHTIAHRVIYSVDRVNEENVLIVIPVIE